MGATRASITATTANTANGKKEASSGASATWFVHVLTVLDKTHGQTELRINIGFDCFILRSFRFMLLAEMGSLSGVDKLTDEDKADILKIVDGHLAEKHICFWLRCACDDCWTYSKDIRRSYGGGSGVIRFACRHTVYCVD